MAILNILTGPNNDGLRKRAKVVTEFDARLCQLLDDMAETMYRAGGVGIAATQVGVLYRACLVYVDGVGVVELVNPEIIKATGKKVGDEGCLSVPNERGMVERPTKVVVRAQDRFGKEFTFEFTGRGAVCMCHEIDHLDGVLFVDKVVE
jgi:peptide deformylase